MLNFGDTRTSLVVQWLRLHASTARGTGSIPGRGTRIRHVEQHGQKYIYILVIQLYERQI